MSLLVSKIKKRRICNKKFKISYLGVEYFLPNFASAKHIKYMYLGFCFCSSSFTNFLYSVQVKWIINDDFSKLSSIFREKELALPLSASIVI